MAAWTWFRVGLAVRRALSVPISSWRAMESTRDRLGTTAFLVKIDAGSHGVLESLPRLVDVASGSVYLRLVPHHLSRLHPPDLRGDFVPCNRDASSPYGFPLLRGTSPVDVTLRGGMRPSDVSAGVIFESAGSQWSRSWWRWIAYALTPFGWAMFATPEFIRKQAGHVEEDLLA